MRGLKHPEVDPYRFINDFDGAVMAATHGSPWSYDTFGPILFAGPSLRPQVAHRPASPTAVASTLAAYLVSRRLRECSNWLPAPQITPRLVGEGSPTSATKSPWQSSFLPQRESSADMPSRKHSRGADCREASPAGCPRATACAWRNISPRVSMASTPGTGPGKQPIVPHRGRYLASLEATFHRIFAPPVGRES